MRRAVVLGGTGAIGQAVARRLLPAGWSVVVTSRTAGRLPEDLVTAGLRYRRGDRANANDLREAVAGGADLLVDCACYTAAHARALLPYLAGVGSTVMISSKAVYADDAGRHVNSDDPPRFLGPISESQQTVAPAGGDFRTRDAYAPNKVAAEQVLLDSGAPVTIVRPSKIHGPGSLRPREWVFVKRVLDRRPAIFLAHRGQGIDHTSAAANIAALLERVAELPGRRILNGADPDAPSALEIAREVANHLHHSWQEILLEDRADNLGAHPWDAPFPIVLDTAAAVELGYVPAGDYASTVRAEIDWLVSQPRQAPASSDSFFAPFFDYAAEDRYLDDNV